MKLTIAIWIMNSVLQWMLLAVVLLKNRWREHPAFTVYIAYCAFKTNLLMWLGLYHRASYFYVNWSMRLVGLPLMIAVLLEVFAQVFQPYSTLPKGALLKFKIALGILVALAACAAFYFPGAGPRTFESSVLVANRSASIIFCGAFVFAAIASHHFGIPWQTRTYGIGSGFLLFMSVDLFTSSLMAAYGALAIKSLDSVAMLAYTLGLITWLTYFAKSDVASNTPTLEEMRRLQMALDYSSKEVESCHGVE